MKEKACFVIVLFLLLTFACGNSGENGSSKEMSTIEKMEPGDIGFIGESSGGVITDKNGNAWLEPKRTLSSQQSRRTPIAIRKHQKTGEYQVLLPPIEYINAPTGVPKTGMIRAEKIKRLVVADIEPNEKMWTVVESLSFDKNGNAGIDLGAPAFLKKCCPSQIEVWRDKNGGYNARINFNQDGNIRRINALEKKHRKINLH